MEAVDNLFESLDTERFQELVSPLVAVLIGKKALHRFRFMGRWMVAVDATGV